ncbi:MAG: helix-turn-helix transcriptional regulator [Nitrospinae bacterium]|nr:helix-turn-helix transcriptional regulator [Nitrospinota bacterium]
MYEIKSAKEIGERIKKRRKELGMSQEKLAEKLDVTYQQIQRYENGTNQVNTEKLQILAVELSVPVSYFFEESNDKVAEPLSQYISAEEERFLKRFRKIAKNEHKRCLFAFLQLAGQKEKRQ